MHLGPKEMLLRLILHGDNPPSSPLCVSALGGLRETVSSTAGVACVQGDQRSFCQQVMQAYYEEAVPQPGQEFEFSADDSLQPVHFMRPPLKLEPGAPEQIHRTQIANAEAEAAAGLRSWTIAVLCRCLSLDNILLLLTGSPRRSWSVCREASYSFVSLQSYLALALRKPVF